MEPLLYALARVVLALIQVLPLRGIARLGRVVGHVVYVLDARHRRVALANLECCFCGEKSAPEIQAIARENFRRIGENLACAAKTAGMDFSTLRPHLELVNGETLLPRPDVNRAPRFIFAIGHFGNFELYARLGQFLPMLQAATTYRALRQPSLNRLMQSLREKSGCWYFERRRDGAALRAAMAQPNVCLGLLADQHAGDRGVRAPFLGRECSTTPAPAIFALRYNCPLIPCICYRTALAHWRLELQAPVPTRIAGRARPVVEIIRDMNAAFETAVRRDPANWFWVHNRWRPSRRRRRDDSGAPRPGQSADADHAARTPTT